MSLSRLWEVACLAWENVRNHTCETSPDIFKVTDLKASYFVSDVLNEIMNESLRGPRSSKWQIRSAACSALSTLLGPKFLLSSSSERNAVNGRNNESMYHMVPQRINSPQRRDDVPRDFRISDRDLILLLLPTFSSLWSKLFRVFIFKYICADTYIE